MASKQDAKMRKPNHFLSFFVQGATLLACFVGFMIQISFEVARFQAANTGVGFR